MISSSKNIKNSILIRNSSGDVILILHESLLSSLKDKPDHKLRKFLKRLAFTKSEQDATISYLHTLNKK